MTKTLVVRLSVAVLFGLPAAQCVAQNDSTAQLLVQGARVRIEWAQPRGWHFGFAENVNSAGFVFRPKTLGANRQVEFSALRGLEVSTGTHHHAVRGLFIGLIAGSVLGYASGSTTKSDYDFSGYVAIVGGVAGGLVGTLVGWSVRNDDWVKIALHE